MTKLVVLLTQGNHAHVAKLIESENWEYVFLITNRQGTSFQTAKPHSCIIIDDEAPVSDMIATIKQALEKEWGEVGLNFVSGTGKEHMALVAAIIQAGLAFRLVAVTKEGIKEL